MFRFPLKEMRSLQGKHTTICNYIENVLDSVLSDEASTIKQSYLVLEVIKEPYGFLFIPRYPTNLVLNTDTYYRIYDIISAAVFPEYTCVRPTSMQLVEVDGEQLATARGFYFPGYKGKKQRFVGTITKIVADYDLNKEIPLMRGLTVGRNATTWIISGNTGSGKSYALRYLEEIISRLTNQNGDEPAQVIMIDPKKSDGARYAKKHSEIKLLIPEDTDRPEDFLTKVNAELAAVVKEMQLRQSKLYEVSTKISTDANEINVPPIFVVLEEMASLTLGLASTSRQVKDLYRELELIALLGRESLINLIITSQIARNDVVPIPIRSQMNVRILLGRIDKATVQYLFPSMTDGLSIPIGGLGTGIIEINDGKHYGIEPIAMPTITKGEES